MGVLSGKTVLVTGGGKRIGKHLCLCAAREGARVVIHYASSAEGAEETLQEIRALGSDGITIQQDFRETDRISSFFQKCWDQMPFDILVNNSAIFEAVSLTEATLENWEKHFAINLTAPFLLSKSFLLFLPENRNGRIINILDWRALRPGCDHFPYTISKAALAAMTKSLAVAAAPRVSVNGIALGAILPPEGGFDEEDILDNYPMRRWGSLEEVGNTFLFLASGPQYVTGETLHLDGGRHLI